MLHSTANCLLYQVHNPVANVNHDNQIDSTFVFSDLIKPFFCLHVTLLNVILDHAAIAYITIVVVYCSYGLLTRHPTSGYVPE